jgi:hypothetical protein
MSPVDTLAAHFATPEAIKKYFGFLGGKRAKGTVELLANAEGSGVARAYTLDRREYEGSLYYVKAIGTRGDLDEATLAELTRAATLLPLGTLRYEGMLAPILPWPLGSDSDSDTIQNLSRLDEGILVYPYSIMSKKGDSTYAFWAKSNEGYYSVEPIDDKKLK